jgi:hypothetical protein
MRRERGGVRFHNLLNAFPCQPDVSRLPSIAVERGLFRAQPVLQFADIDERNRQVRRDDTVARCKDPLTVNAPDGRQHVAQESYLRPVLGVGRLVLPASPRWSARLTGGGQCVAACCW